ncbi:DUF6263 family protein [Corynebacterium sp.]|uniref:DUF6263 family protein n=1 Tax=Corynebacterium sp. TaxID=1720 RepID=UPI0026DCD62D|nr:DUF6263 family protein [Corynebacterium sp.]
MTRRIFTLQHTVSSAPQRSGHKLFARLGTTAVAAAAAVSLAACSSESAVDTQPVDVAATTVELTDAGHGEMASVRWKDDGAEQNSTVVITQGFAQRGGDAGTEQTFPDTRLEVPLTSTTAGDADTRAVTAEVGEPHGSNAELNADIATAQGFLSEWTAKNTGEVTELRLGAPEKATDTARAGVETALQQLHSMPIIFPTEDIGTDATWTVESKVEGQTQMTQKVTYTLLNRTGDIVNLKVDVKQVPTVTELDTGGDSPLKVIESTTEMLSDRVTVDLTKPLPVKGNIDYVTAVTYGDGTSDVRITQQTHRGVQFKEDRDADK